MSETGHFAILLNPGQSQPCPGCGMSMDLASQWKNHVLVPESKLQLASHRVTKHLSGYFITATVVCPSCHTAFEIYANAAYFRHDQMKCHICRRTEHMEPDVQDVQYDDSKDAYIVSAIVYCRHCWMLAWVLSLLSRLFRPAVAEVELVPAPRRLDNTLKNVLEEKLSFLQEKQAINADPSLGFELAKSIEEVEKQLASL